VVTTPVFLILIGAGFLSGIIAGLLGVGGGILLTPICAVLYPRLGISAEILYKIIFGTNFFVISFSSLVSSFRYHLRGLVLWRGVFPIAFFSIFGAVIGSYCAASVSNLLLKRMFGIFMLLVAIRLYYEYKPSAEKQPSFFFPALALTGLSTAVLSVMIGVGGGILTIPIMVFLLHYPLRSAPGTSSSIIVFTSIAGMAGYAFNGWHDPLLPENSYGYVYLDVGIPLMLGAVIGAPVGTWINAKISTKRLRQVFGVVMAGIFVKMTFF